MSSIFESKSYYEILEIKPTAGGHEIRKAYEKAKEAYSPSSPALYTMFSPEEAKELNQLIEMAFTVLSNSTRKAEYDNSIADSKKSFSKLENLVNEINDDQVKQKNNKDKMSQTCFGSYEIDSQFEDKISKTQDFDGPLLQKIRHYKNITLEQLSEKSKISKTYILAIESHDFEALPAKVFVRGFVFQIAKLLDLNPQIVTDSFLKLHSVNN